MSGSRKSAAARGAIAGAVAGLLHRLEQEQRPEHGVVEGSASACVIESIASIVRQNRLAAALGRLVVVEERRELGQEHGIAPVSRASHIVRRACAAAHQAEDLLGEPRAARRARASRGVKTIAS